MKSVYTTNMVNSLRAQHSERHQVFLGAKASTEIAQVPSLKKFFMSYFSPNSLSFVWFILKITEMFHFYFIALKEHYLKFKILCLYLFYLHNFMTNWSIDLQCFIQAHLS